MIEPEPVLRNDQCDTATSSRALIVLLFGAVFASAVVCEVPYVNGSTYWRWNWISLDFGRGLRAFAAPALVYGFLAHRWLTQPTFSRREVQHILFGLICCALMFMGALLYMRPKPLAFTVDFVQSSGATGYYTDALKVDGLARFLRDYANLPRAPHSETHPPAPVIFWWACVKLAGARKGIFLGTALIALATSLSTLAIYRFSVLWTQDRKQRLGACFLWTLLPGLLVNLPEFDQIYPWLTIALLLAWRAALAGTRVAPIVAGAILFVITFFAYNLLTLGAPMLAFAGVWVLRAESRTYACKTILLSSAGLVISFLMLHVLFWIFTSYDPINTFVHALQAQDRVSAELARPYAPSLFFSVYDFFLAAGMIALPLLVFYVRSTKSSLERQLTLAWFISILVIDISGLLPYETARLWLFLQPLIVVPAGLQLARFRPREGSWILGMQALISLVLRSKMEFFP